MEINKLNDKQVNSAQPHDKDYRLNDGAGLYLVVTPKWWKAMALVL
jgi:hypothetical protein